MVASVQELIAAAEAQKPFSPVASSIQRFLESVRQGTRPTTLDLSTRMAQLRQAQSQRALTQQQIEVSRSDERRARQREENIKETTKRMRGDPSFQEVTKVSPSGVESQFKKGAGIPLPKGFEEMWAQDLRTGTKDINQVFAEKTLLDGINKTKGRTPEQVDKLGLDLLKIFIDRPEVKEFVFIETQINSMDKLMEEARSGNLENRIALDQALVTMFNKLTDPGSVVRESEFARTPQSAPIINRILGTIAKIKAGGIEFEDEDREALIFAAKIIGNQRGKQSNRTRTSFGELAMNVGADPNIVTGTIPKFKPFDTSVLPEGQTEKGEPIRILSVEEER